MVHAYLIGNKSVAIYLRKQEWEKGFHNDFESPKLCLTESDNICIPNCFLQHQNVKNFISKKEKSHFSSVKRGGRGHSKGRQFLPFAFSFSSCLKEGLQN